ncbi:hypothetical protein ACTFIU_011127 [Dictyostelium citrinum]
MDERDEIIKFRKNELETIDMSLATINSLSLYVEKIEEDYESIKANYLILTHMFKKETKKIQDTLNKSNGSGGVSDTNQKDTINNNNNNKNNNNNSKSLKRKINSIN